MSLLLFLFYSVYLFSLLYFSDFTYKWYHTVLFFSDISFSIISSKSIYIAANGKSSIFLWLSSILLFIYVFLINWVTLGNFFWKTSHILLTGMQSALLLWKTICQLLTKLNLYLPYDPEILLLIISPREVKTNQMSVSWWADKQNVLHQNNGILLNNKKKKINATTWMNSKTSCQVKDDTQNSNNVWFHLYTILEMATKSLLSTSLRDKVSCPSVQYGLPWVSWLTNRM